MLRPIAKNLPDTNLPARRSVDSKSAVGRIRTVLVTTLAALLMAVSLAACSGTDDSTSTGDNSEAPSTPDDPDAVVVDASSTTTMELGGGARLIVPPGSIRDGATVRATYVDPPRGSRRNQVPLAAPVELMTSPKGALVGMVTLEFPAPDGFSAESGTVGISTYDPNQETWKAVDATYDSGRDMIVTQTDHFSWWNPFTWDWADTLANANQTIGELLGKRVRGADCESTNRPDPTPAWVSSTAGITNDAAIAIRACTEGEGDIMAVELINNRPYSMYLDLGSTVKWTWHETGTSVMDQVRNELGDKFADPDQLYLPPLGRASVGIEKVAGNAEFRAGFGYRALAVDALSTILGEAVGSIPDGGPCLAALFSLPFGEFSVGKVADGVRDAFQCVVEEAAGLGYFDDVKVSELENLTKGLGVVNASLQFGDLTWKLSDLFFDGVVVADTGLGAGFSVLGRADVIPEPTTPINPPHHDINGEDGDGGDGGDGGDDDGDGGGGGGDGGGGGGGGGDGDVDVVTVFVSNQVTNGPTQMREDDAPAYLSTMTRNGCYNTPCMLAGTEVASGAQLTAHCVTQGDRTTNGQNSTPVDDTNPGLYTSTTWYGVTWPDGRTGFISEVWLAVGSRGGLGLKSC